MVCFLKRSYSLVQTIVSDTLYYSNRHYKMSSTYKIHLPNGKSWLTLQKRGNSNIISSVLHYFFPKNFCFFPKQLKLLRCKLYKFTFPSAASKVFLNCVTELPFFPTLYYSILTERRLIFFFSLVSFHLFSKFF